VVAIESDPANPNLSTARDLGAIVVLGDAREPSVRRKARLAHAHTAVVACGDDSTNLDVVSGIRDDPGDRRTSPLRCLTHIMDPTLAAAVRDRTAMSQGAAGFELKIFNVPENAARRLVRMHLTRAHAPSSDEVAHYVIVGFGVMGQTLALQSARLAHVENHRRLRMSIVDDWTRPEARRAADGFLERFPAFCPDPGSFNLERHIQDPAPMKDSWLYRPGRPKHGAWRHDRPADAHRLPVEYVVNAEFLELTEADSPAFVESLALRFRSGQVPAVKPVIVVCFDNDRKNLESALRLSAALIRDGYRVPVYVYIPDDSGLTRLVERTRSGSLGNLVPFGAREESASYEELTEPKVVELASTFRQQYLAAAATPDVAFTYQKSDQDAGYHADIKLDAVFRLRRRGGVPDRAGAPGMVFTPEERHMLAIMEHNRYMAERLLDGWRYGPRDDAGKRRESLCPWEHLPEEEQRKDFAQIDALAHWLAPEREPSVQPHETARA
jgi:hypothetical protein